MQITYWKVSPTFFLNFTLFASVLILANANDRSDCVVTSSWVRRPGIGLAFTATAAAGVSQQTHSPSGRQTGGDYHKLDLQLTSRRQSRRRWRHRSRFCDWEMVWRGCCTGLLLAPSFSATHPQWEGERRREGENGGDGCQLLAGRPDIIH